ncbi:ABC transporter substrate-binding protein [Frankia sp. CNm7]|uniref:ABC transporter substrate-binding protein n=1 Tax=Frankia nepalensis TaxID=1836974 RepID=A0A937RAR4_9ACTN|nr:ABC transporter substrate-binding protein [Frankia nepalensis]MBL7498232.1 ABC transporter substrate-binding protein [Frankia nepalensis]MBL7509528.1 ABC transporter substrate-binding protein [Frankia nepalensis]MBL7518055.1 ABC transporter substrate-binding protein [Frankia nepalensis]MBL7626292.1 ABC transporter substrate-binding protein [Frankia nepalensis]
MTSQRRIRRYSALLLAATTAIAVAACSVESNDDNKTPPAGTPTAEAYPPPPAPAEAPGVTADSIKIGVVYPDLSVVKQYVDVDHGDYEAVFQALIDKVNADGGIAGRKIVPVYGAVDVISPTGAQETCVRLTEDEKVFAVIGSLNAEDVNCYVQTHKTVVVGGDLTAERYSKAQAPWVSDQRGGDELPEGLDLFIDDGVLTGKKLAVVAYRDDQATLDKVVLPTLRDKNIPVTETGVLDADTSDPAAVSSQLNVFIQKFQSAGVDTVLLVGGSQAQFPAELQKTSYRPRLLFASNNTAGSYVFGARDGDLSVLEDSLAIGQAANYTDPAVNTCLSTVEAALPETKGKIIDPALTPAKEPAWGTSESVACRYLALFQAIAEKAGKDLTYKSFQDASFSLGSFDLPTATDGATYSRQTPNGAIPPRIFAWDATKKGFFVTAG